MLKLKGLIIEELFSFNGLSKEKRDNIYNIFKKSYDSSVGVSWSRDKFFEKSKDLMFFGDEGGFVAIRKDKYGFYKFVLVGGDVRGILVGLKEIESNGFPLWGLVSGRIKDMLIKRGYKSPSIRYIRGIMKEYPDYILSGLNYRINLDSSINILYSDIGEVNKYFIGNDKYFNKLKI